MTDLARVRIAYRRTLYDESWLHRRYIDEAKTATEIGVEVGCPTSTVLRAIRRFGMPVRHEAQPAEERKCQNPNCEESFLVGGAGNRPRSAVYCSRRCHTLQQTPRWTGSDAPRPKKNATTLHNKEWLTERYVTQKMSMGEIGLLCNCSATSVSHALRKFDIPIRSASMAKLGKKHTRSSTAEFDEGSSVGRAKLRNAAIRLARKKEMVDSYGGACDCCGEKELAFLCLDHKQGGGMEERTRLGGSEAMMQDLKKRGWPKDGYRILCANCNLATKLGRTCPHQLKESDPQGG